MIQMVKTKKSKALVAFYNLYNLRILLRMLRSFHRLPSLASPLREFNVALVRQASAFISKNNNNLRLALKIPRRKGHRKNQRLWWQFYNFAVNNFNTHSILKSITLDLL